MTTITRPCKNCTTPAPDTCGCTTSHAPMTLTASAPATTTTGLDVTSNPFLCTCELADPGAVSMLTLTAAVTSVMDCDGGPYPVGMPVGVGELLLDGPEGDAFAKTYRATMMRHDLDCPTHQVMAAVARGVLPAAQHRALRRYGPIGDAVSASRSDVLVAAALAPLGKMIEIAEPPTEPGPPDDPHGVLSLPREDDMIPGLIRSVATAYGAGDWLSASRSANSLATMLRERAVRTGQLIASAAPARRGDGFVAAALSHLDHVNAKGDPVRTADAAREVLEFAERAEQRYFDEGFARFAAELGRPLTAAATPPPPPPRTLDLSGVDADTARAVAATVAAAKARKPDQALRANRTTTRALRKAASIERQFDILAARRNATR